MTGIASEGATTPVDTAMFRLQVAEAQGQLVALLDGLQTLAGQHKKHFNLVEGIVFLKRALNCINRTCEQDGEDWPHEMDWRDFGQRLRDRRRSARLQQKELATLVGVTAQTIRNIEGASKRPSRDLFLRLLAVPELNLHVSDITGDDAPSAFVPTSWLAPQYDPIKMLGAMFAKLNGSGDSLEQSTAYLDSRSAADWLDIASSPGYLALYGNDVPLQEAAQIVTANQGRGLLEICALGSGDGRRETAFSKSCAELLPEPSELHLYLLDISHALLTEGYNRAIQALDARGVRVRTMHGNFHDLSRFPILEEPKKGTRRVFTMLGNTLANLDNEVRFFRDTLSGCVAGDYFLADFTCAHGSADDPDEIRRLDPVLQSPVPAARANWLGGPLRRYCKEITDIEFSLELDTHSTVRGSYEHLYVARARVAGGKPDRRFVMFRMKMYDPGKFQECLSELGWECELMTPYAANERNKIMLMLLRKR